MTESPHLLFTNKIIPPPLFFPLALTSLSLPPPSVKPGKSIHPAVRDLAFLTGQKHLFSKNRLMLKNTLKSPLKLS